MAAPSLSVDGVAGSGAAVVNSEAMITHVTAAADWLAVAPVVGPLAVAALLIMLWTVLPAQRAIAFATLLAIVAANIALLARVVESGPLVMTMGRWLPPFGISFTVDALGAVLSLTAGIATLLACVYAFREIDEGATRFGFYPLMLGLLAGVNGAFLTGDLFNMYVWFEVFVISSFGLIILGGHPKQIDGAVKYVFLNLIGTTMFLIAVGYLYGAIGTLNMADIAAVMANRPLDGTMGTIGLLFLLAFGMKAAAFPVYFWLPASYHTPKVVVSALFAGLLTKVGIYALLRTFTILMPQSADSLHMDVLYWVGIATVLAGAFGALVQVDLRRMLSFLLIGGIGVMMIGLAVGTEAALAATVFYAVHSIVVMTALYLITGVIFNRTGSFALTEVAGLYRSHAALSAVFLVLAFALAGLPPFSGFWPKAGLIKATLDTGNEVATAAIILNGVLATLALVRAWGFGFWRPAEEAAAIAHPTAARPGAALVPVALLATGVVILGLMPAPLYGVAELAAKGLLNPVGYNAAVFGGLGQ